MTDSTPAVRLQIDERTSYADGRRFGQAGRYEKLSGRVHFAIDPLDVANAAIVDLKRAPRNDAGLVEYAADLEMLVPQDLAAASGTLFYDVNNRGRRSSMMLFNEYADHFLLRRGMIVVWSGWLAEVLPLEDEYVPGAKQLRLDAPVASGDDGQPLTGWVRAEAISEEPAERINITGRAYLGSYRPVEATLPSAKLTWRLCEADERVVIPHDQWRLEVETVPAPGHRWPLPRVWLHVAGGIRPGFIYELIYEAVDPVVQGLGLTGIRDLVSFLKYDKSDANPVCHEGVSAARRAVGFGTSQSGRCLRTMLHLGLNADPAGRMVFDGLIPHVSGAGLGFFNHRFASPTRFSSQHADHLFPCDLFPFTYGEASDPFNGRVDSLLAKAQRSGVAPKIMHIQNSTEYWHRGGSLVHTDAAGEHDAEIPAEVRIYAVAAQHGPGDDIAARPPEHGQLPHNPLDYRFHLRAMLAAMEAWLADGAEPPPSCYPRLAAGTLVKFDAYESGWLPLAGVRYPEVIHQVEHLDHGPHFAEGLVTEHPPRRLGHYRVLVPVVDDDNNERDMVRLAAALVPLGTYTGWSLRATTAGAPQELLKLKGSFVPFAATRRQRLADGDPRQSLEERYGDFAGYRKAVEGAARRLVSERLMLEEELPMVLERTDLRRGLFASP